MAFNFLLLILEGFYVCTCCVFSDKLEMLVLCLNLEFAAEGNLCVCNVQAKDLPSQGKSAMVPACLGSQRVEQWIKICHDCLESAGGEGKGS